MTKDILYMGRKDEGDMGMIEIWKVKLMEIWEGICDARTYYIREVKTREIWE